MGLGWFIGTAHYDALFKCKGCLFKAEEITAYIWHCSKNRLKRGIKVQTHSCPHVRFRYVDFYLKEHDFYLKFKNNFLLSLFVKKEQGDVGFF